MTLTPHLHIYLKFSHSLSNNTEQNLFLHRSSPVLAQLCPLTLPKIKGDTGTVGAVQLQWQLGCGAELVFIYLLLLMPCVIGVMKQDKSPSG